MKRVFFAIILSLIATVSATAFGKPVKPVKHPKVIALTPDKKALLEEIVNINSGTENPEGNEAVRQKLIPIFKALGFSVNNVDLGNDRKVLVIDFPGSNPDILIIGHTDTIFPKDSPFDSFVDEGNILRGPGISDMKAGIILAASLMENLPDPKMRKRFRLVFNDDEEIGSPSSEKTLQQAAQGVKAILSLEPEEPGFVTISHSGLVWFDMAVKGVAAHAGSAHQGINACVELGHKMVEVAKLTDFSRGLSLNAGVITGGIKPNVVCENASMKADMRYIDFADRDMALTKLQNISDTPFVFNDILNEGTISTFSVYSEAPSMPPSLTSDLFKYYENASTALSIPIKGKHKGGVDSYGLISPGMKTKMLSGLGASGSGFHSDKEILDLEATEKKFQVTLKFLSELKNL